MSILISNYSKCKWFKLKRQRVAEWKKKLPNYVLSTREVKIQIPWKWKNENKPFNANSNQKKVQGMYTNTRQIDIKSKTVTRDKEGHHIFIKGSIHQENITIINIYVPKKSTKIYEANIERIVVKNR